MVGPTKESEQGTKDPIYEVPQKCPVCSFETFYAYRLLSKTQMISLDDLLMEVYEGIRGYKTVDYNKLKVIVCPRCFYASERDSDFISLSTSAIKREFKEMKHALKKDLNSEIETRKSLIEKYGLDGNSFGKDRDYKVAMVSYLLAALCSEIKAKFGVEKSHRDTGLYYLKAAKMGELAGETVEEVDKLLYKTSDALKKSYEIEELDVNSLAEVFYLIIYANLVSNRHDEARTFLGHFDSYRRRLHNVQRKQGGVSTAKIDNYYEKIRDVMYDFEVETEEENY